MWCLERNIQIHVVARHFPGSPNKVADEESRILREPISLDAEPTSVQSIIRTTGSGPVCVKTDDPNTSVTAGDRTP